MNWIYETQPLKEGEYLAMLSTGKYKVLNWCEGWNCFLDMHTGEIYRLLEITNVVCWAEIPAPDRRRICK